VERGSPAALRTRSTGRTGGLRRSDRPRLGRESMHFPHFPVYGKRHDPGRQFQLVCGLVAGVLNPRHWHGKREIGACGYADRARSDGSSLLGEQWCGTAAVVPPRTVRLPRGTRLGPRRRLEKPGAPAARETCVPADVTHHPGPHGPISFSLVADAVAFSFQKISPRNL